MFNNKVLCIAKDGYPVEGIIKKPFKTFVRKLILTRKFELTKNTEKRLNIKMSFDK